MIKRVDIKRNSDGYWNHPYLGKFTENHTLSDIEDDLKKHGYVHIKTKYLEYSDSIGAEEAQENYWENGKTDISMWRPEQDMLISDLALLICDTDDGPLFLAASKK